MHALLEQKGYRVASNREFFNASPSEAVKAVIEAERVFGSSHPANSQTTVAQEDLPPSKMPWDEVLELADASYYGHDLTIQDYAEASRLYNLAAKMGASLACLKLGTMSKYGQGCKEDRATALEFFKQGTRLGDDRCWGEMATLFSWDGLRLRGDRARNIENALKCWTRYFGSNGFREDEPRSYIYNRSGYVFEYLNEVQCGLLPLSFKKELCWHYESTMESTAREAENLKRLAEKSLDDEWYREQAESRAQTIQTYQRLIEAVDSAIFASTQTRREIDMLAAYAKLSEIKASSGWQAVADHLSEKPKPTPTLSHGEDVRLLAGPFSGFTGMVEDINPEKRLLKVKVNVFGRSTPVELSFLDVEKLTFS